MSEGTVAFLPFHPLLRIDDDVIPVWELAHFFRSSTGEKFAAGDFSQVMSISPEPKNRKD